jgi:hypothetical protein
VKSIAGSVCVEKVPTRKRISNSIHLWHRYIAAFLSFIFLLDRLGVGTEDDLGDQGSQTLTKVKTVKLLLDHMFPEILSCCFSAWIW